MKTLFSNWIFCILVLVTVTVTVNREQCFGGGSTPIVLREWAGYSGISDSAFKNPVLTDGDYSYTATVSFDSVTGPNITVIKLNSMGQGVWKKDWSSTGFGRDQASGMAMDTNYLYVCGATFSSANNFDFITMKLKKSDGHIEWTQTFNGAASNYDIATAIVVHDSSIYVTGVSFSTATAADYHTIKYRKDGALRWSADFDYNNLMDIPFALSYSEDDSTLIVAGASQSNLYDWDYETVIYHYAGSVINQNRVSGSSAGFDRAQAVTADDSGYIYITGATFENATDFDIKNVKLDKTGNLVWLRNYDSGNNDIGNDIIVDTTGQPYICGSAHGNGQDFFIAKLNRNNGGIDWSHTINIDGSGDDSARAMCFDSRGNIIVTGQVFNAAASNYDFLTIAYTSDGGELWRDYFDGPYHGDDNATDITADTNGNIYVTGQVTTEEGIQTVTIKYRTDYFLEPPAVDTPSVAYEFYPNSGQLIDVNDSDITDSVHYYTVHHYPQLYFGFGVMNMVWNHVDEDTATTDTLQRVDVTFLNSTNQTEAYPNDEDTSSYLNYYLGHCPNGITNVHGNGSLVYTEVWPDIDVIYSSNNAGLKMTFICNPGSNPQEIGLAFDGQDDLMIYQNWYLRVQTLIGKYDLEKPRVYQLDTANNRVTLNWQLAWDVSQPGEAVFTGWDSYDSGLPIIIEIGNEPNQNFSIYNYNLNWSTHYGGTDRETAGQITRDDNNFIYTIGSTMSSIFPLTAQVNLVGFTQNHGGQDAIITKFSAGPGTSSNLIWATYYGGPGTEEGRSIAANYDNTLNNIYFTGLTTSPGNSLPTADSHHFYYEFHQGGAFDAFIAKLNTNGGLEFASHIGGGGEDVGNTIAINQNDGSVYVGGQTSSNGTNSPAFPCSTSVNTNAYNQNVYGGNLSGGIGDGFIMKFNPSDDLLWSTFFGGSGEDAVAGITVLDNNDVVVVGNTNSAAANSGTASPFCLANNNNQFQLCDQGGSSYFDGSLNNSPILSIYDLFLSVYNSSDQLIWSTYFGGNNIDFANFGNPISTTYTPSSKYAIVGQTYSSISTFPVLNPTGSYSQGYTGGGSMSDAFIAVFSNEFDRDWCSYYGGDDSENGNCVAFDSNENLYFTGTTGSQTHTTPCPTAPSGSDFPLCNNNSSFYYNSDINLNFQTGSSDAFLAQFNQNYGMSWSTYIGGSRGEFGKSIIVNESASANDLFFFGTTFSPKAEVGIAAPSLFPPQTSSGYYDQSYDLAGINDYQISMFDLGTIVGIDKVLSNKYFLEINPNPAYDNITIQLKLNLNKINNSLPFEIYDLDGRCVLTNQIKRINSDEYKNKINIECLSSGMYFIKINSGIEILTQKLIIQK